MNSIQIVFVGSLLAVLDLNLIVVSGLADVRVSMPRRMTPPIVAEAGATEY